MQTLAERMTALWIREMIFRSNTIVNGNIVFTVDVYRHYSSLYRTMQKTSKTERYVISRIADALSLVRIFLKTGQELGRGRTFFYNANRTLIGVGLSEHLRLSKRNVCYNMYERGGGEDTGTCERITKPAQIL